MMRRSVRKRLARVLTTYSWAGSLPKPQDLGSSWGGGRGDRSVRQGYAFGPQGGSWQSNDAYMHNHPQGYAHSHGYGHPLVPAAPEFFVLPPGPGPAQLVKGLGAAMHSSASKGSRQGYTCGQYGHFAHECPLPDNGR